MIILVVLISIILIILLATRFKLRGRGTAILVSILALVVIISSALLFARMVSDYFSVDKCLDNGGRWDETTKSCQHS